ncbi:hypothetical protein ABVV53_08680 [Novosphingobium sp. RD2P27]|uniref:DUF3426 domain-containing protein n=1 Tax=Novosphingobium kalidii TaxID=3230299 RepID=A0ABV2D143_9SPHN
MTDRDDNLIGWIGTGIIFALMMQVKPFRWCVYLVVAWLGLLAVQDWWSEHEIPAGSSSVEWAIEAQELNSASPDRQPVFTVEGWFRNHGDEALESAVLAGRLYECPHPESDIELCIPVAESSTPLTLDLKPGFLTHFLAYPAFRGAGGPNPRIEWEIQDVIADSDWSVE